MESPTGAPLDRPLKPDKGLEAIKQMPERFRKIMRADPTWRLGHDGTNIAETEKFLNEHGKIRRESIKDDMFKTVFGVVLGMLCSNCRRETQFERNGANTIVHRQPQPPGSSITRWSPYVVAQT